MNPLASLSQVLLNRFAGRLGMSFIGVAIAGVLVWYLGPLIPGIGSPLARGVVIVLLLLVWAGVNSAIHWHRRRKERALAAGVTNADNDTAADAAAEVAELRQRMQDAIRRLRGSGTRGYLYEQPWYVLIGPPGSGKTTALLNSGLHFPLSAPGDDADPRVAGVGGTRLCDWWFTDEAVLIDTAGRYTTQDSDAAIDRAGWEGFLDLLGRTRPRQPINGVLIFVPLPDIAAADPAERAAHARAVRRRVNEISDRLRLRVPVYMVFSKADQITGYSEYFDDLDAEARAQVWGMTFPLARGVELFAAEFRLLLERLERRLFERLQAERAPGRRAMIAGFPLQMASLGPPVEEFLGMAFGGTRLDPAPLLRGVYMTSATQEGTPIDRLTGMLARAFGVDQKRVPSLRPVAGRAYFLGRLLADVILGEALLGSTKPGDRRRRLLWRIAGYSAVGVATLAGMLLLWRAEGANQVAIEQANTALAAYRAQLEATPRDTFADDDLPGTVRLLDAAGALPHGPVPSFAGLGEGPKLDESVRLAYRRALERILLPRLVWRVEAQMRTRLQDPDFLYAATRVYLMLGGAGPLDPALVQAWETADWAGRFPGVLNADLRDRLAHHLNALLAQPLPAVPLDETLLGLARASFGRVSLAQRVYSRLRPDVANAAALPDWTPASALGPAGWTLFVRRSGKPLTDGIPRFYTGTGERQMLAALPTTTRAVAAESWVLGEAVDATTQAGDPAALERAVVALYVTDTEKQWDMLLDDLALARFGNRDATIQNLYVLASPQSPMRDLLTAIVRELPPLPARTDSKAADTPDSKRVTEARVTEALGAMQPGDATTMADAEFDRHYAALRSFVGQGTSQGASQGTSTPLTAILGVVNALQAEIARSGPNTGATPGVFQTETDPVQQLRAEAQRQPAPVQRWLQQIAATGQGALDANAQAAAGRAYEGANGPGALCRSVVQGHYPFDQSSTVDAPIDDFARLFAPNGAFDGYFKTQLAPYTDTSRREWRLAPLAGVAPPVDAGTIRIFQRAAMIRDTYFASGGATPELRFSASPAAGTKPDAKLLLGGVSIGGDEDRANGPRPLLWPGADGMQTISVKRGDQTLMRTQGPWALFRLLDVAHGAGSGGTLTLDFGASGQEASFVVSTEKTPNPLRASLLRGFQCPAVQ